MTTTSTSTRLASIGRFRAADRGPVQGDRVNGPAYAGT